MKKITAIFFAAAGFVNAQTYNYDAANETLTITGKGNSVQDRITLEGPITPGSTVPGSSETFGNTKTIILKDVWTSPDSIRVAYTQPTCPGENTTLKLENSRLGASGDFDKGGLGQTLILDSKSELNLYGNRLTNTTRLENEGYIECINGTVSSSSYLWDNKTSTGSSGILGGRGYYNFGNVESIETSLDFGLIRSNGQITDLEISGEYTVGGNSAKTNGDNSFIAGVNAANGSGGHAMTISGKLTIEAKQGTGIGILANQLGNDDVSLKNDYSGEITVKAKDAFCVKVGTNAAKDAATAGDIYSISIGTLNVESTITSGTEQGTATGIYAKSVKRNLTANNITVKGYTEATGIQLTEGGKNLSITNMQVSAANGTATGILAGESLSQIDDLENIDIANMEVSGNGNSAGIIAKSVSGKVGNITVSSENGNATGIYAESADISVSGTISSTSTNAGAYGILTENDLNLTMKDGAEISASAASGNDSFAVRSANGNANLTFEGAATINGNVSAKDISLINGGTSTINGDIEGESLATGATIGTITGKMKFDTVGDMEITSSVGSLEVGTAGTASGNITVNTVETSANILNANSATIENANGNVSLSTVGTATVNNATGDITAIDIANGLNVGNVANVNVGNTNLNVLDGKTVSGNIASSNDLVLTNGGSATIAGSVSVSGKLTINSAFNVNSNAATVISATTLAGSGLRDTINNHYNNAYGFADTDDANGNLTAASSLKGQHNVSDITGTLESDLAEVSNAYTKVKYKNIGNNVGYDIIENSYLRDAVASNESERALAEIYDNLEYVEGDDAANALSVSKKRNFAAMVSSGTLGAMLPQSVVHTARMNMDLTDIIHLDTLNRTSASADYLASLGSDDSLFGKTFTVSVRNINRFAFYGGDENIDASSDYITGALANVEYTPSTKFFAGFGFGGFQAKSTGRGNCGKGETQSIALNAYANWRFLDNFDWYMGATYAFGMNKAERRNIVDQSRADWDSNLLGIFTGVRYAIKPFADKEFYIKPTIGVNANFLMNPAFEEKSGAERMRMDSQDYTSVKSLIGIEATYMLDCGFYFSGRMFYTHEFADNRYNVNSTILGTSASLFTKGWKMDEDTGVFGIGIGYNINSQWRIYADYAAEISGEIYQNINTGIQFKF